MEILKEKYSITELSERLNVTDHALRYYEREFNLKVPKGERGRRCYTPELANIMYQIKTMRDNGLEIKAIKKILESQSETCEPPPVVLDDSSTSLIPLNSSINTVDIRDFLDDFKNQITTSFTAEMTVARDHISREIQKSKLELGACVENSVRKLESKMEKHFADVDKSISDWRDKNQKGLFNRLLKRNSK